MENEKRLIVANELAERVSGIGIHFVGLRNGKTLVKEAMEKYRDAVLRTICEAPTVDAVEVVHGEWRDGCTVHDGKVISHSIDCSVCQGVFKASRREVTQHWKEQFKICPFCGAVMDGDVNV